MKEITLEALLEAGCHFGHQTTRQNPKARDYVFEARDNIHIIDLVKTKEGLETAAAFIKSLASKGDTTLLIVGTKRQAQPIVDAEIKRAEKEMNVAKETGLYFVTKRWIGGTITNFNEVEKNFKKLKDFESRLKNEEEKMKYTKKEIGQWEKERQKLNSFYSGIVDMKKLPNAVFVIDTHTENLVVREARHAHIPVVGIVDTNADPSLVDYIIPANDDAVGSIEIITKYIMDAWIEGKTQKKPEEPKSAEEKKDDKTAEKPKRTRKKKEETQS